MSVETRDAKVFAVLLVSMTLGAVTLMLLGNNPPKAGAFCLSSYRQLNPVDQVLRTTKRISEDRWNRIKIRCRPLQSAGTAVENGHFGNIDDYHFLVCNGVAGNNGQIIATSKWQNQHSISRGQRLVESSQTIRICIMMLEDLPELTDFQVQRVQELVDALAEKFSIRAESISYPPMPGL